MKREGLKHLRSQVLMFSMKPYLLWIPLCLIPPLPTIRPQVFYFPIWFLVCLLWDIPELLPWALSWSLVWLLPRPPGLVPGLAPVRTLPACILEWLLPCQMPPGGLPKLEEGFSQQKHLGIPPHHPQSAISWHKSTWGECGHFPS